MPPGPLGWLTIAPELLAVWKIQAQMVSDLAGVYGKAATLTREHMVIACSATRRCRRCGTWPCALHSDPQEAASRDGCQWSGPSESEPTLSTTRGRSQRRRSNCSGRDDEAREAARGVVAVAERERAAVGLGDLARESSPMPLPPGLVVKKGTNRLSGFATPGPWSFTSKTTLSSLRMARSSTAAHPRALPPPRCARD